MANRVGHGYRGCPPLKTQQALNCTPARLLTLKKLLVQLCRLLLQTLQGENAVLDRTQGSAGGFRAHHGVRCWRGRRRGAGRHKHRERRRGRGDRARRNCERCRRGRNGRNRFGDNRRSRRSRRAQICPRNRHGQRRLAIVGFHGRRRVLPARQCHFVAKGGQACQCKREVKHTGAPSLGGIDSDRLHRPSRQDGLDQIAQYVSGADFEKRLDAIRMHGLNLLDEIDRMGDLASQHGASVRFPLGIRLAGSVRVNGHLAGAKPDGLQRLGKGKARIGDQRAVKRGGYRQDTVANRATRQCFGCAMNLFCRSRQHLLRRRISIRHDQGKTFFLQERRNGRFVGLHRQHGAAAWRTVPAGHQLPAHIRETVQGIGRHAASATQGNELAITVATGGFQLDSEGLQDTERTKADSTQCRLRDFGRLERGFLRGTAFGRKGRWWINEIRQRRGRRPAGG